jgi:phosphatidylglycerol:prolipoprotein diacylglycerol transferase
MSVFIIFTVLTGFIGARLTYLLFHLGFFFSNPLYMIKYGGMTIYGAIILGIIEASLFIRYLWHPIFSKGKRLSLFQIGDICAPGVALGEVFGRIGCLMGGCCYGKPTSLPWAISYKMSIPGNTPVDLISIHPTQLYHSISALIIFLILMLIGRRRKDIDDLDGKTFLIFLLLYSIFRFIVEIFRGDDRGEFTFGYMSTTQMISLCMMIIAVVLIKTGFHKTLSTSRNNNCP